MLKGKTMNKLTHEQAEEKIDALSRELDAGGFISILAIKSGCECGENYMMTTFPPQTLGEVLSFSRSMVDQIEQSPELKGYQSTDENEICELCGGTHECDEYCPDDGCDMHYEGEGND